MLSIHLEIVFKYFFRDFDPINLIKIVLKLLKFILINLWLYDCFKVLSLN